MAVERGARIGRIKPKVTPRIGCIRPRNIAGRIGEASNGSAGEGEDRVFEGLS